MSVEDTFTDHVALLERQTGKDALGHPVDTFATVDDFWCQLSRSSSRAARDAAGILDLPPWDILAGSHVEIRQEDHRLEILSSPWFTVGTRFKFLGKLEPVGVAGDGLREATLVEEIARAR